MQRVALLCIYQKFGLLCRLGLGTLGVCGAAFPPLRLCGARIVQLVLVTQRAEMHMPYDDLLLMP
jgi:hypothetical protein